MDTGFGPLRFDDVTLRPVFDPRLRTFSVQLWTDGEPDGIHGLFEAFEFADEAVETINPFLEERGVRPLTVEEMVHLYGALFAAKDPYGPDFQLFLMQFQQSQKQS